MKTRSQFIRRFILLATLTVLLVGSSSGTAMAAGDSKLEIILFWDVNNNGIFDSQDVPLGGEPSGAWQIEFTSNRGDFIIKGSTNHEGILEHTWQASDDPDNKGVDVSQPWVIGAPAWRSNADQTWQQGKPRVRHVVDGQVVWEGFGFVHLSTNPPDVQIIAIPMFLLSEGKPADGLDVPPEKAIVSFRQPPEGVALGKVITRTFQITVPIGQAPTQVTPELQPAPPAQPALPKCEYQDSFLNDLMFILELIVLGLVVVAILAMATIATVAILATLIAGVAVLSRVFLVALLVITAIGVVLTIVAAILGLVVMLPELSPAVLQMVPMILIGIGLAAFFILIGLGLIISAVIGNPFRAAMSVAEKTQEHKINWPWFWRK